MNVALRAALAGARDAIPLMVGTLPFGVIFGGNAVAAGLTPLAALAMSAVVFAGSAQFIAISLLAGGAALPVIWLTTLVVNLRHALYSATLQPATQRWSLRCRTLFAFWLTDEAFAVIEKRLAEQGDEALLPYALGASGGFFVHWLCWTAVGAWVGTRFPDLAGWGLDFAMIGSFAAMVAVQLRAPVPLVVALIAGTVAWFAQGLPYKLGLVLAALCGVLAGAALDRADDANGAEADA